MNTKIQYLVVTALMVASWTVSRPAAAQTCSSGELYCSAGWCCPPGAGGSTIVCCNSNPESLGCTSNGNCSTSTTTTTNSCSGYSSCGGCTGAANCGWCGSSGTCMEGTSSGPVGGSCGHGWAWVSSECSGAGCSIAPIPSTGTIGTMGARHAAHSTRSTTWAIVAAMGVFLALAAFRRRRTTKTAESPASRRLPWLFMLMCASALVVSACAVDGTQSVSQPAEVQPSLSPGHPMLSGTSTARAVPPTATARATTSTTGSTSIEDAIRRTMTIAQEQAEKDQRAHGSQAAEPGTP